LYSLIAPALVPPETRIQSESYSQTALSTSAQARHAVAFTRDAAEGCAGSTWAFAHGDNFGRVLENGEKTAQKETQLIQ
jgi:hypothetical protein